ncbi:hypothetical protein [Xanthomonas sacchari]|uniref:hypothetical protein n=1 Tax=Xanthomonas sacchari TaxID=56458 RepID=UPI0012E07C10|nr:hypothetical protein [Xanthomonas sacchari]
MVKIIRFLGKGTSLLLLATLVALVAYDALAVRPHLARIRDLLTQANSEDAAPPEAIRRLIDAMWGRPPRMWLRW